jgi:hypothetical protein
MIGFENGTDENARADGNIRGTYGKPTPDSSKARDFLGISKEDLRRYILSKFPLDDRAESRKQAEIVVQSARAAEEGE